MSKDETRAWITDLLANFSGQENTLIIPRTYIDITGNIEDALLLSQIVYWTDRTKMDDGWFAKSYAEWQDEIALSKYQVMAATKRLAVAGVETMVRKFNGAPTVHYRLRKSDFALWIVKKLDERKSRNLTNDSEETSQSSTETTSEITADKNTAPKRESVFNIAKMSDKQLQIYYDEHVGLLDELLLLTGIDVQFCHWREMDLTQRRAYVRAFETFLSKGIDYHAYTAWLTKELIWRKPLRITLKDFVENIPKFRTAAHTPKKEVQSAAFVWRTPEPDDPPYPVTQASEQDIPFS